MKTPMNVFNTAMKKKNKNRKGFSLVELIVVLVIMAILAAALVPTLIGYIRQTRQSNAKNEAAAAVSAAQTVGSSAFADPNSIYHNNGTGSGTGDVEIKAGTIKTADNDKLIADVTYLAEVNGTVSGIAYSEDNVVTDLAYTDGTTYVYYYKPASGSAKYGVGTSADAAKSDAGKS